ncbi:unnamed protein product [Candidula unifasciata]|uniref:HMG box domain-containing protein n=1 Tax=Candidula unifasciata TaxID=100452 RepID=A0A8S3YV56_9EUPU|nr:unnamed protein product [Candidula unifasciata]
MALPNLRPGNIIVASPVPQKVKLSSGTPGTSEKEKNSTPFLPSPHGHPNFTPTRSRGMATAAKAAAAQSEGRVPKPPKPPDKPLMPYMRYSRKVIGKVWEQVKAQNPDLKLWEIGKIIGQMWRDLSDQEKQEFQEEYDVEKTQYTDALKAYHNSPAYQAWIAAKAEREAVDEDEPVVRPERPPVSSHKPSSKGEGSRISILPMDDDDDLEDGFTTKHIAQARYIRNHRLINEIFSDMVVPDVRSVVTEARMTVLKRQVQSLTMHQKKLEGELHQIEDKHEQKKKKFMESNESFHQELKRLCESKPQISDEMFSGMVNKAVKDELKQRQHQHVAQPHDEERRIAQTQISSEEGQTIGTHLADGHLASSLIGGNHEPMEVDKSAVMTSSSVVEANPVDVATPSPHSATASEEVVNNIVVTPDKNGTELAGTPITEIKESSNREPAEEVSPTAELTANQLETVPESGAINRQDIPS